MKTHGKWKTKEWYAWNHILRRCTNPNYQYYDRYGGRGIKVCDRWLGENGFVNFFEDMGEAPSSKHSVDRKESDKDYTPENCRWATDLEQQNNRTNNVRLEYNGISKTLSEWSRELSIPKTTLSGRYKKGLPTEKILATEAK